MRYISNYLLMTIFAGIIPSGVMMGADFQNLIQCSHNSPLGADEKCSLINQTQVLATAQPIHSNFKIDYNMSCDPRAHSRTPSAMLVTVTTENGASQTETLFYKESGSFSVDGYGPVTITDTNPKNLFNRKVATGCNLSVSVSASKSQRTINEENNATAALMAKANQQLTDINSNISQKQKELITYHSWFVSDAGGKEIFYCMIKTYDDPVLYNEQVIQDLKNHYSDNYQETYESGKYSCPCAANLIKIADKCEKDPLSERSCSAYSGYKNARVWFTAQLRDLDTNYSALNDAPTNARINEAKSRLEKTLNDSLSGLKI